jgi:hypothetical protein
MYKKYIEKDGKVYGPYVYKSKRVNGKIVSEYCGQGVNKKKIFIFAAGILVLFFLVFMLFFSRNFTGNAISENPVLISAETEKVISYPEVYFTLISIQKQEETSDYAQADKIINETNPEIAESPSENLTEANINQKEPNENLTETNTNQIIEPNENSVSENSQEINSATTEETKDSVPEENSIPETETEETSSSEPSIAGSIGAFFLGLLKPTGMAVLETTETKIEGKTSMSESFTYHLKEGENVQLLSGSVKTQSISLPDNSVRLIYQDGILLVETNYSEISEALKKADSEEIKNNNTLIITGENNPVLNSEEENVLAEHFGNYSIQTIKSELFNNRYILGYKLGEFTIEYSYDSSISNESLKMQTEKDKIKWLKDISGKLTEKEKVHTEINFS